MAEPQVLWLVLPEGNGKTTLLAALGLYGLRFGGEASIPVAASTRDQARIMYRQMKGFVSRSGLHQPDDEGFWFECFDGYRQIHLRRPGDTKRGETVGQIEVHAADAGAADGVIPWPFGFLDELHRHKDLALHRTWRGKLNKRTGRLPFTLKHFDAWCKTLVLDSGEFVTLEPFQRAFVRDVFSGWGSVQGAKLIVISTAGEPGHEFETTRDKIKAEASKVDKHGAFIRYATDKVVLHDWAVRSEADILDAVAVKAANPLKSITRQSLAEKLADPTMTESHWRRMTCNIPTLDEGKDPFLDLRDWDALATGEPIKAGSFVCLGGDGSRTWDTTVIAWADCDDEGIVTVEARVFSVRKDIEAHVFHDSGKIDFDDVEAFILDRFDEFQVEEAAYDPRYLERSMEIVDARLAERCIFPVEPSSKAMRDALQALFNLASEGQLRHTGDPVIRSHVANTGVERGFGSELRRVRKIDPRMPIDAVPAMALAVWRAQHMNEFADVPLAAMA
jgi:phage terminase large subunit-like protein